MLRWLCTMWSLLSCQITHSCSTVISDAPENVKTRCTETPSLFLSSVVHPPSCASNVRCRLNRLSAQIHDELSCSTGVTRRVLQPVLQLAGICELTTPCCDDIKGCGLFICDSAGPKELKRGNLLLSRCQAVATEKRKLHEEVDVLAEDKGTIIRSLKETKRIRPRHKEAFGAAADMRGDIIFTADTGFVRASKKQQVDLSSMVRLHHPRSLTGL
eukprot:GHVS01056188.1.p1 GENE.GHVS01056188.1~~GHVS01056188.1.p1  ORF type:complete len:215 (+),score=31.98 GHVS01056188.1:841-1485(+)